MMNVYILFLYEQGIKDDSIKSDHINFVAV